MYNTESLLAGLEIPVVRANDHEVRGVCPAHQENTGKRDSIGDWYIDRETGKHICFSCGFRGDGVVTLVAYVLDLDIWQASRWARRFAEADLELLSYDGAVERKRAGKRKSTEVEVMSDAHLAIFSEVPTELLEIRRISDEAAKFYELLWSREERCWILPMRTETGELIGYQKRAKGWERNHPDGVSKSTSLFGMDRWSYSTFDEDAPLVLVESPLDAARLYAADVLGGVSSYGAMVSDAQMKLLVKFADVGVVVAMDNDAAGWNATQRIWHRYRQRLSLRFANYTDIEAKDAGDMTDEEVHHCIEDATPLPVRMTPMHRPSHVGVGARNDVRRGMQN